MSTPAMHLEAVGASTRTCDHCRAPFTPKRGWARFCGSKCRNDFHGAEARKAAIVAAAPAMFEVLCLTREMLRGEPLEHVVTNHPAEPVETLGTRLDNVLGPLKPPEKVKA